MKERERALCKPTLNWSPQRTSERTSKSFSPLDNDDHDHEDFATIAAGHTQIIRRVGSCQVCALLLAAKNCHSLSLNHTSKLKTLARSLVLCVKLCASLVHARMLFAYFARPLAQTNWSARARALRVCAQWRVQTDYLVTSKRDARAAIDCS